MVHRKHLRKNLLKLAVPLLFLALAAGCNSVKSMPFETFAKVERGAQTLPDECLEVARRDMEIAAWWQATSSKSILEFWEKMAQEYGDCFEPEESPEAMDQQIDRLVSRYVTYPYKEALRSEMIQYTWPYGLKKCPIGSANPGNATIPAAFAGSGVQAVRAWPLWIWGARPSDAAFPKAYAGLTGLWPATYAAHRKSIRTFWLSANLTMQRQEEYMRVTQSQPGERIELGEIVSRSTIPLPILPGYDDRLFDLRARFATYPVFVKDLERYHALGSGNEACPLSRTEVYAQGKAWTVLLFSRAAGVQWLATGQCRPGEPKPGRQALYLQEGAGWFVLPAIGFGRGSVVRYVVPEEGVESTPGKRVASALSLWPLFLYGRGEGLSANDEAAIGGNAFGIPLLFAYADIKKDKGVHATVKEALHFLLYAGLDYSDQKRDFSTHLVGLGLLWTSHYNAKTGDSYSGVLWGLFGWGRSGGADVIRIFGFPIRKQASTS